VLHDKDCASAAVLLLRVPVGRPSFRSGAFGVPREDDSAFCAAAERKLEPSSGIGRNRWLKQASACAEIVLDKALLGERLAIRSPRSPAAVTMRGKGSDVGAGAGYVVPKHRRVARPGARACAAAAREPS